ncbi:unnamed protein product [Cochlearia groenlandica]
MEDGDCVELKFRLEDGTDIGPSKYNKYMTIASLKEKIIAQWPKDIKYAPKMINEVKLINGGKILENNRTICEARSLLFGELRGVVTTMHVVLRPPIFGQKNEKMESDPTMKNHCVCCIL